MAQMEHDTVLQHGSPVQGARDWPRAIHAAET